MGVTKIYGTYNGKTLSIHEWSKETGLPQNVIYDRVKDGWSWEKALTTPKGAYRSPRKRVRKTPHMCSGCKHWRAPDNGIGGGDVPLCVGYRTSQDGVPRCEDREMRAKTEGHESKRLSRRVPPWDPLAEPFKQHIHISFHARARVFYSDLITAGFTTKER